MPDIEFQCESCKKHLVVDDAGAGLTINCPACNASLIIPAKQTAVSETPTPAPPATPTKSESPVMVAAASTQGQNGQTKKCPFCSEEILATAKKCKHCGSMIDALPQHHPGVSTKVNDPNGTIEIAPTPTSPTPPTSSTSSPSKVLSGLIVFASLWLLIMGFCEWYGGSSTRNLYKGTVLETDSQSNTIVSNAESAGVWKMVIGGILFVVGVAVAGHGEIRAGWKKGLTEGRSTDKL